LHAHCESRPGGASVGGLIYTDGAFNQSTVNGQLGLGGISDNLGAFTLSALPFTYDGQFFNLLVTFTAPPGAGAGAFTADLTGTVLGLNGGGVFLDFDNNSNNPLNLNYTGGSFQFWVNDVNISSFSTVQILSGGIRSVPEPATWAMMLLGFGGIGFAMRRRQKPALAQLA
jgi:PEP-CTERM motif-containing protein